MNTYSPTTRNMLDGGHPLTFFLSRLEISSEPRPYFRGSLITFWHTMLSRTSLDEWSAHRRDLCLLTLTRLWSQLVCPVLKLRMCHTVPVLYGVAFTLCFFQCYYILLIYLQGFEKVSGKGKKSQEKDGFQISFSIEVSKLFFFFSCWIAQEQKWEISVGSKIK